MSLTVGFLVVIITMVIGIPLGAVAGYFGGWIDNVLMRITDAALALPALLVLILLSAILREIDAPFIKQNNVLTIALVIGILSWMSVARLVRATFLKIMPQASTSKSGPVVSRTPPQVRKSCVSMI